MLAPAINSSSWFLSFLWTATYILALGSLAVLFILFLRRLYEDKQEVQNRFIEERLSRYLYVALNTPVELTKDSLPSITDKERRLLVPLSLNILRNLQGNDINTIISVLKIWGMQNFLLRRLDETHKGSQIQILSLLSHFSSKEVIEKLTYCACHSDTYIQIEAIRSLAGLSPTKKQIEDALAPLKNTPATNTLLLTDALKRFDKKALPLLHTLSKDAQSIEIRNACITALGTKHSIPSVPTLIKLLKDPIGDIRSHAAIALGQIGDPRANKPLMACLKDKNVGVRVQTIHALGKLQCLDALALMAESLEDSSWWVRFRSAEALYMLGDQGQALLKAYAMQKTLAGTTCSQFLQEKEGLYA